MREAAVILVDHPLGEIDADKLIRVAVQNVGDGARAASVVEDADGVCGFVGVLVLEGGGGGDEWDVQPG